jgi:hypothetical protein
MFGMHKDERAGLGSTAGAIRAVDPCNEETFHYFLTIQRQRSERSGRPFSLLVVELKDPAGQSLSMESVIAASVFSALRRCLRDTDIVGWYRTGWAAGAVLTELGDGSHADAGRPVGQRVKTTIAAQIPQPLGGQLSVIVYQLRSTLRS